MTVGPRALLGCRVDLVDLFRLEVQGHGCVLSEYLGEHLGPRSWSRRARVARVDDQSPVSAWEVPQARDWSPEQVEDDVGEEPLLLVGLRMLRRSSANLHPTVEPREHVHRPVLGRIGRVEPCDVVRVAFTVCPLRLPWLVSMTLVAKSKANATVVDRHRWRTSSSPERSTAWRCHPRTWTARTRHSWCTGRRARAIGSTPS